MAGSTLRSRSTFPRRIWTRRKTRSVNSPAPEPINIRSRPVRTRSFQIRYPPARTASPPRDAIATKAYARAIRNARLPKRSTSNSKKLWTDLAPEYPVKRRNPALTTARSAASSLRRKGSPLTEDPHQGVEIFGMGVEVLADRRKFLVQSRRDARLQVLRMQLAAPICLRQVAERFVHDVPAELRVAGNLQAAAAREEDQTGRLEHRIPGRLLRGAERLPDLALDLLGRVVQEEARVRLRLRHLAGDQVHAPLALEARQEGRVQCDNLLPAELRSDVAVEHVGVPLVHPAEREVEVHPVDVGDLHRRVNELRRVEVRVLLRAAHDRQRAPDARDGGGFRDADDLLPVLRMPRELVRVAILDRIRDADRAEGVLEVLGAHAEVLEIRSELVVDVRVPVCQEDDRMKAGPDQVADLRADDERGPDVHQPGRLEAHKPPNLPKQDKGFNSRARRVAEIRQWP